MWRVMGHYGERKPEELDTAPDEVTAEHLRSEYEMAFGGKWLVWIEEPWEGQEEKW